MKIPFKRRMDNSVQTAGSNSYIKKTGSNTSEP
jgi:hypothetical protein